MLKDKSPFEFLVFNPRPQAQEDRFRAQEASKNDEDLPVCSSSEDFESDDSAPPPDIGQNENLSSVMTNICIPKNPLSDIGDPSENRLLKITNSPTVGALTELKLRGKGLSHFGSSQKLLLSRLFNLSVLDLASNYISEISDISQCPSITYLNISSNLIADISPVSSLSKLITLKASENKISNLSPLESCEKLQKLCINNNSLNNLTSAINSLKTLTCLKYLTIHSNPCINKTKNWQSRLLSSLSLLKLDKRILNAESLEMNKQVLQSKPKEKIIENKEEAKEEAKIESSKAVKLLGRLRLEKFSN